MSFLAKIGLATRRDLEDARYERDTYKNQLTREVDAHHIETVRRVEAAERAAEHATNEALLHGEVTLLRKRNLLLERECAGNTNVVAHLLNERLKEVS